MDYRAVCVSGALGAGAPDVAELLAARLGFRLIDEEILARAAAKAGVEPGVVADVERRRSLLARLLEGLGETDATSLAFGAPAGPEDLLTSDDLRGVIRTAIEEAGAEGNVVIVAHAASVALGEREDVLRVLVTASPETRRHRFAQEQSVSVGDASKEIAFSDKARADYLKRFYGIQAELPTLYDLVVNTDRLTPEAAAAVILRAVGAPAGS